MAASLFPPLVYPAGVSMVQQASLGLKWIGTPVLPRPWPLHTFFENQSTQQQCPEARGQQWHQCSTGCNKRIDVSKKSCSKLQTEPQLEVVFMHARIPTPAAGGCEAHHLVACRRSKSSLSCGFLPDTSHLLLMVLSRVHPRQLSRTQQRSSLRTDSNNCSTACACQWLDQTLGKELQATKIKNV